MDITQGQNWTVDTSNFNFYAYNVSLQGDFNAIPPPWNISLFAPPDSSPVSIQATYNFEFQEAGAVADGYWESLVYDSVPVELGVVVSNPDAEPSPLDVTVAGIGCTVNAIFNASEGESRIQAGVQPVSVDGNQLLGVDAAPLILKGYNYFGFEVDGNSMVDGLWEVR